MVASGVYQDSNNLGWHIKRGSKRASIYIDNKMLDENNSLKIENAFWVPWASCNQNFWIQSLYTCFCFIAPDFKFYVFCSQVYLNYLFRQWNKHWSSNVQIYYFCVLIKSLTDSKTGNQQFEFYNINLYFTNLYSYKHKLS